MLPFTAQLAELSLTEQGILTNLSQIILLVLLKLTPSSWHYRFLNIPSPKG
jgi:hypothetical protein